MDQSKLWTKDFLTGTLTNFFLMLNYYLLVVIMTVYAMDSFGAPPIEAGLASSIFIIGTLVARPFCGRWINQVGERKMFAIGVVLSLLLTVLYFGVNNIWFLFATRFLHGAAYGIAATAIGTIITHIIPDNRRGEGIGYFMLSLTLASAVGPFLGMFIVQHGSFEMIFSVCTVSAALSSASIFILPDPKAAPVNVQPAAAKGFKWNQFFEGKAVPISIVCAIIYFCYSSLLSFLTPFAKDIHLADAASFFFIVYSVAILISRPFTGKLFDIKGENITMYPAFVIFMLGMALLSQAHHGLTMLTAAALLGFGVGVVQSCGMAIAVKVTPKERLGLANSTFYIFLDVGVGIGPVILGVFVPLTGYRGLYLGMGIIALAGAFLYYLLHGRKAMQKEKQRQSAC